MFESYSNSSLTYSLSPLCQFDISLHSLLGFKKESFKNPYFPLLGLRKRELFNPLLPIFSMRVKAFQGCLFRRVWFLLYLGFFNLENGMLSRET